MFLHLLVMMLLKTMYAGHCPYLATKWNLMIFKHVTIWKKDTVIVKFKCRKQKHSILINRKNFYNKSDVLTQLNFSGRLFVLDSMSREPPIILYDSWKMLARFIPHGFGITPSILNLMKEVNQQRFIMLLIFKNFLEFFSKWLQ